MLTEAEAKYLRDMVHSYTGIALDANKHYLLESRLLPVARGEGLGSLNELVVRLRAEPLHSSALLSKVVEAMTTNETSFFRDLNPFEALREKVLPALIASRAATRTLHIWSAACSSGQEPYSIAMLIREHFPQLNDWTVRILATDFAPAMLAQARTGRYSQLEVNRGLPVRTLAKYFEQDGTSWRISEDVRRMIEFRSINLIQTWAAMPTFDVVFMRNVLIYFDQETKRTILKKLRLALRTDGYLFLGGAETTLNLDDAYERVEFGRIAYYRLSTVKAATALIGVRS